MVRSDSDLPGRATDGSFAKPSGRPPCTWRRSAEQGSALLEPARSPCGKLLWKPQNPTGTSRNAHASTNHKALQHNVLAKSPNVARTLPECSARLCLVCTSHDGSSAPSTRFQENTKC